MKISLKWLNDFVDVSEFLKEPQGLADLLTRAGLEVEDIQQKAKDLQNVVVGHIQVKDKHPNADKLSLCQVETAPGKIEQIVCGAQNHKQGDKVVVALPGAVLPGNFAIKKSKIRDVESHGMLCSLKELGLAQESDGLYILPASAPTGQSFAAYAGYDDVVFELKVTPNRADCLSHYGLAREIGCLLNRPVKPVEIQKKFSELSSQKKIQLKVDDAELCPRYCGRYIANVKIGPSPDWLVRRLESIGMNSINNVVDVTNYVMLEMGQPLHAFDADQIKGAMIHVRQAQPLEKMVTLKEQEVVFKGDELLICDGSSSQGAAVALAGVIGGLHSGVSDSTKNIFIESANFKSMSVRKSSRQHGIETDSAYRFSRGVDPSQTFEIMDRAVALILQVAGGEAYSEPHDFYPNAVTKKPISIKIQTVTDRLGYVAEASLFEQYMTGLKCQILKVKEGEYSVIPPLFRFDLEHDMDLVEEYARLKGYEHITETLPVFSQQPAPHDAKYLAQVRISQFMRAEGFDQAFNYAFLSDDQEKKFIQNAALLSSCGLATAEHAVAIRNPLSEELNVMRRSLSLPIWKNVIENFHAGNFSGKLFEVGQVFEKSSEGFKESRRLVMALWGEPFGLYSSSMPLVFQAKGTLEKWLQALQISAYTFQTPGPEQAPAFLHKGQWAQLVCEGKAVGFVGAVHPVLLAEEKIRVPVCLVELNLEQILQGQPRPVKFKSVSHHQPVERDFAFVMDSTKIIGDMTKEIKKSVGAALQVLTVFDIYEGEKLPQGQKSVALRVRFQSMTEALSENQIQELSQKVVQSAEKSVGARLR